MFKSEQFKNFHIWISVLNTRKLSVGCEIQYHLESQPDDSKSLEAFKYATEGGGVCGVCGVCVVRVCGGVFRWELLENASAWGKAHFRFASLVFL